MVTMDKRNVDNHSISNVLGSFIDPEDKCSSCICHDDGDFTCEPISCPDRPPCRGKRVVTVSDQCCAQCKCRYKGNLVNPGKLCKILLQTCVKEVLSTNRLPRRPNTQESLF